MRQGKTVAGQVRQVVRHLGDPDGGWRVRGAFYGRAGSWSAAALDDMRRRFAAWSKREQARMGEEIQTGAADAAGHLGLATRLDAIRAEVAKLHRDVEALAAEVSGVDR